MLLATDAPKGRAERGGTWQAFHMADPLGHTGVSVVQHSGVSSRWGPTPERVTTGSDPVSGPTHGGMHPRPGSACQPLWMACVVLWCSSADTAHCAGDAWAASGTSIPGVRVPPVTLSKACSVAVQGPTPNPVGGQTLAAKDPLRAIGVVVGRHLMPNVAAIAAGKGRTRCPSAVAAGTDQPQAGQGAPTACVAEPAGSRLRVPCRQPSSCFPGMAGVANGLQGTHGTRNDAAVTCRSDPATQSPR
mmetsp:Transcript_13480/g.24057  ORF Transcript_13480/g.24057 Transcript_13480/m.24057 type:complete len:246 (+) Transcript_13480:373-1110(+)